MKLILASQSPRRKELLERLGYDFDVIPSCSEEIFDADLDIDSALEKVAYSKASSLQKVYPERMILSADTIVLFQNEILGKPADLEEAAAMLRKLSGCWHEVKTGVCVLTPRFEITFVKTARVKFKDLSEKEIDNYVSTCRPLDKAGAYGIQEVSFAESLEGDFDTVVGLPAADVKMVLDLLALISAPEEPDYFFDASSASAPAALISA